MHAPPRSFCNFFMLFPSQELSWYQPIWMNERMNGWMDEPTNEQINRKAAFIILILWNFPNPPWTLRPWHSQSEVSQRGQGPLFVVLKCSFLVPSSISHCSLDSFSDLLQLWIHTGVSEHSSLLLLPTLVQTLCFPSGWSVWVHTLPLILHDSPWPYLPHLVLN